MRFRLALIATLITAPALAQDNQAAREQIANRIALTTEALSQFKALDNGIWISGSGSHIKDSRPGLSRKVDVRALQFGYDRRFASPFTAFDQLVLGVAGAVLDASSRFDAQNLQVDSRGWSVTGYGVSAPYAFLSFPVAVTIGRWSSDQTRDGTNLLPTYRASYNSPTFASSAGAALTLPASRFLVTTGVTHQYSSTRRPAYSEAINPLATDFVFTPAETTEASQLIGTIRLTLPFEAGRVWASAGYAHDLKRSPSESTRSEMPLAVGVDLVTARWLFGVSGQTILRNDITSYTGSVIGRLQF
jgi:hypothetical protein